MSFWDGLNKFLGAVLDEAERTSEKAVNMRDEASTKKRREIQKQYDKAYKEAENMKPGYKRAEAKRKLKEAKKRSDMVLDDYDDETRSKYKKTRR